MYFRDDDKTSVAVEEAYVSKFRQALPQFCAVGAKNLLLLTFGSSLGFSTILIPALQSEDTEIHVTMEELTWISKNQLVNKARQAFEKEVSESFLAPFYRIRPMCLEIT